MIRYITVFILQLKNCLGYDRLIGCLSLRVVLSAKHLVSNKGHITHARQQRLIGFLKFCRLLLNMVCGYLAGGCCVVCLSAVVYLPIGLFCLWVLVWLGLACFLGKGYF